MCHHYDSDTLAHWERERETEEDDLPDDPEPDLDDETREREDREPATPPADD